MNIEVKKVKLTKSLISQMMFISMKNISKAKVLGFLVGVRKGYDKIILLEYNNDYYLCDERWIKREKSFSFMYKRWSYSKKFKSAEECNLMWEAYSKKRGEALKTHLYV